MAITRQAASGHREATASGAVSASPTSTYTLAETRMVAIWPSAPPVNPIASSSQNSVASTRQRRWAGQPRGARTGPRTALSSPRSSRVATRPPRPISGPTLSHQGPGLATPATEAALPRIGMDDGRIGTSDFRDSSRARVRVTLIGGPTVLIEVGGLRLLLWSLSRVNGRVSTIALE